MQEVLFKDFVDYNKRLGKIIISGDEGFGKDLLTTAIAVGKMLHGFEDCNKSYDVVDEYNSLGFEFSKDYEHLCFANYDINCSGTSIPDRKVYVCNPFKLGFFDPYYWTDLFPPFALFCLTEGKNYFDSYEWNRFPNRYISWIKTMRHARYDMLVNTQYFGDICTPFRRITNRFIYLDREVEEIKDSKGVVVGHRLFIIEWRNNRDVEYFERTSKKQNCKEYVLKLDKCFYSNYDGFYCRLLHLRGRIGQDFRIEHFPEIKTLDDLEYFVNEFGFHVPEGFYKSNVKQRKPEEFEPIEDLDSEEFDF